MRKALLELRLSQSQANLNLVSLKKTLNVQAVKSSEDEKKQQ